MRAVLTAVIAAIEAAAVAVAVFFVVALMSVLVWWLVFDLAAEPSEVVEASVAVWQLAHFVPMKITLSASTALSLGLSAEAMSFTISLAPLGLTLVTASLAARSGWRFAARGASGAWAVLGGTIGFAAAATAAVLFSGSFVIWPIWGQILVPTLVFAVPIGLAFVVRSALDGSEWWFAAVRRMQQQAQKLLPNTAAALPERATETLRLAVTALMALIGLAALGTTIAIVAGYVEIVTLSQSMHLDGLGTLLMFILQLALLPVAWVWGIAWFAGPGFALGAATSVSPFEVLLGPVPALPLFGAIPGEWGWAGALAPALVVALATVLGGIAGGGSSLRRAPAPVAALVPICASVLVGLATALLCTIAGGSIGPGRMAEVGAHPWLVGGVVAAELAFGMTLGVFARRFDQDRLRHATSVESLATLFGTETVVKQAGLSESWVSGDATLGDDTETMPVEPLPSHLLPATAKPADAGSSDDTVPLDPLPKSSFLAGRPESAPVREPAAPAPEPAASVTQHPEAKSDAKQVDPLLHAYSWDSATDATDTRPTENWRDRLRARLARGDGDGNHRDAGSPESGAGTGAGAEDK